MSNLSRHNTILDTNTPAEQFRPREHNMPIQQQLEKLRMQLIFLPGPKTSATHLFQCQDWVSPHGQEGEVVLSIASSRAIRWRRNARKCWHAWIHKTLSSLFSVYIGRYHLRDVAICILLFSRGIAILCLWCSAQATFEPLGSLFTNPTMKT